MKDANAMSSKSTESERHLLQELIALLNAADAFAGWDWERLAEELDVKQGTLTQIVKEYKALEKAIARAEDVLKEFPT